jgi:hypothetical protein
MIGAHIFWWLLTMACVVWYSTITVYVAIKGAADIKTMLTNLRDEAEAESGGLKPASGEPKR